MGGEGKEMRKFLAGGGTFPIPQQKNPGQRDYSLQEDCFIAGSTAGL